MLVVVSCECATTIGRSKTTLHGIHKQNVCTQIIPEFVGLRFEVHNGKEFKRMMISEEMVGHKLGEFSPTRTKPKHPSKYQK